jgi:hypothetical protein
MGEFGAAEPPAWPGRQWAAVSGKGKAPDRSPRRRMRATYYGTEGVRHLLAAYELGEDKLLGYPLVPCPAARRIPTPTGPGDGACRDCRQRARPSCRLPAFITLRNGADGR